LIDFELEYLRLHIFVFHNLHEIFAHIVWLPPSAVIYLDILEEAEEECVNCNRVDSEAGGGDDVGAHHDQQDWDEAEMKLVFLF